MLTFPRPRRTENIIALGQVIYTHYAYIFQIAGLILFVAMIGAIALTLRDQDRFIKKQNIGEQIARTKSSSVELVKVENGAGIDI